LIGTILIQVYDGLLGFFLSFSVGSLVFGRPQSACSMVENTKYNLLCSSCLGCVRPT